MTELQKNVLEFSKNSKKAELLLKGMSDEALAITIESVKKLTLQENEDLNHYTVARVASEFIIKEVLRNRWSSENETIVNLRNKIIEKFGESL